MTYKLPEKTKLTLNKLCSVHLEEESYDRLNKIAEKNKIAVTAIVRDMVKHCLNEMEED